MTSAGGREVGNNVFDYFLVSGLSTKHPLSWITEDVRSDVSSGERFSQEVLFKPFLLCRFPTSVLENSWNTSVQGTLLQLCHPNGISLTTKDHITPPVFHSFPSTRDDGFRTYGHVLTYYEVLSCNTVANSIREQAAIRGFSIPPEQIYAQKCICLISRHAYINTAESILQALYRLFAVDRKELKSSNISIDSYIYNLLYEMPIPAMGSSLALKWDSVKPIVIQNPSDNELPLLDTHLSALFSLLGNASNVLRLLTSAFLEHQILLVSKDCQHLTIVAESITALMFPFQWLHLYAPVLPYHLARNFLDAPVPYIMGIPLGSSGEKLTRITSEFDQCFVDIDKALVECPEDQPSFPSHIKLREGLNSLFKKFQKQMEKEEQNRVETEELGLALIEEEDFMPSPPLHRRNAQKRLSTIPQEEDAMKDTEGDAESVGRIGDVINAVEELKNLHAVCKVSSQDSGEKAESLQLRAELKSIKTDEVEIQQQLFNVQVRENIFGTLISLLSQYDKFVILPDIDDTDIGKQWFLTRESQQNFDKSSFLSDQPERHLQFLSAFLETQAFASLVDSCILSQIDSTFKDSGWTLFDNRIKQAKSMPRPEMASQEAPINKSTSGIDFLSRSGTIISAGQSAKNSIEKWIKSSESSMRRRFKNISGRYPRLRSLESEVEDGSKVKVDPAEECLFPNILFPSLLLERVRDSEQKIYEASVVNLEPSWLETQRAKKKINRQASISEFSPEMIAQTNWKFLEKLLKDVKAKTNKLVVRKMGQEAIALGHTESSIMGLEENTLIGSLCDLLERIWCHGLHSSQKKGKSALWSHLLRYEDDSVRIMRTPAHSVITTGDGSRLIGLRGYSHSLGSVDPSRISPELVRRSDDARFDRRHSQPGHLPESRYIMPVPTDIISNIKRIRQLKEVKTNVGKCRAWIRLSLEQKQLQVHLKKLLLNRPLLQTMYKKYSLLRCDEEREQFLYHLLSLNAVDFTCFTNSFTKTAIQYRVWIFPKKHLSGISQTSANVYVIISGELSCTDKIAIPKNCTDFRFQHQNLGVLTTAILGHDNTGLLPKWLVDYVIVRNEVTGQAYYMPCKRWLGRGVDDGSMQRLLLSHSVPHGSDLNAFISDASSGKITIKSPSLVQKPNTINELRDSVGQVVNAIVKHFHTPTQNVCAGALTPLLCKSDGLVTVLMQIFQHGLKTSGVFRRQLFAWDVVSATCDCLSGKSPMLKQSQSLYKSTLASLGDFIRNTSPQRSLPAAKSQSAPSSGRSSPQLSGRDEDGFISQGRSGESEKILNAMLHYYDVISGSHGKGLGKDDMFQLLVCFGLKEHFIADWVRCISSVLRQGTHLYDKNAFLCDQQAVSSLSSLLDNLSEYSFTFEPILLRGLENLG